MTQICNFCSTVEDTLSCSFSLFPTISVLTMASLFLMISRNQAHYYHEDEVSVFKITDCRFVINCNVPQERKPERIFYVCYRCLLQWANIADL